MSAPWSALVSPVTQPSAAHHVALTPSPMSARSRVRGTALAMSPVGGGWRISAGRRQVAPATHRAPGDHRPRPSRRTACRPARRRCRRPGHRTGRRGSRTRHRGPRPGQWCPRRRAPRSRGDAGTGRRRIPSGRHATSGPAEAQGVTAQRAARVHAARPVERPRRPPGAPRPRSAVGHRSRPSGSGSAAVVGTGSATLSIAAATSSAVRRPYRTSRMMRDFECVRPQEAS